MKILKIIQGFTTNSSGAYEWLPPESYSTPTLGICPKSSSRIQKNIVPMEQMSSLTNQQVSTSSQLTQDDINLSQYRFIPKTSGGLVLFFVSFISGLIAAIIILREIVKNKKNRNN